MNIKKLLLALLLGIVMMPSNCSAFGWLRSAWQKAGSYYRHYSSYMPNYSNYIPVFMQIDKKREMQYKKPVPRPILDNLDLKSQKWTLAQMAEMESRLEKIIKIIGEEDATEEVIREIIEKEAEELGKGCAVGFHGRKSSQLIMDLFFKKLLEMYYARSFKESWQTLHHKFPDSGEYLSYEEGLKNVEKGCTGAYKSSDGQLFQKNMLYMSSLYSNRDGASAINFVKENINRNNTSSPYNYESLFEKFGLKKYYYRHKKEIQNLSNQAKKINFGTLLMISLKKSVSDELAFTSKERYGFKKSVVFEDKTTGNKIKTTNMYETCKLLQQQNYALKTGEPISVMALTDDDKKTGKLGTANPFNTDIDSYRFHIHPEDQKIVQEIEAKLNLLFKKIRIEIAFDSMKEKIKSGDILKKPAIYQGLEREI